MSLASYLLKYLFIHRSCRVPWNEVRLSRTAPPHSRPCFIPLGQKDGDGRESTTITNVEFNVSHQASFVALAGAAFLSSSSSSSSSSMTPQILPSPAFHSDPLRPQVGIDVTCVDEPGYQGKKHHETRTVSSLEKYVDIFTDVFSTDELETIKDLARKSKDGSDHHANPAAESEAVKSALRLFFTFWALKEAYIKMTGEALLAPWLRELVFTNVRAPDGPARDTSIYRSLLSSDWGVPYADTQIWVYGKKVEDVRVEVVGFEEDYLVATAARGGGIGADSRPSAGVQQSDPWQRLEKIDIERDVAPCSRGRCQCLDEPFPC